MYFLLLLDLKHSSISVLLSAVTLAVNVSLSLFWPDLPDQLK